MVLSLVRRAQYSLRAATRRAAFGTVGGLFILVGVAFLTIAAWIYLASQVGAMLAALIIGLVFMGIGLLTLAIGMRRPRPPAHYPPTATPTPLDSAALVDAFLGGLAAGRGLRKK